MNHGSAIKALLASSLGVIFPAVAADLAAPNLAGVSMGHLHYTVRDVAANEQFWVSLGGTAGSLGELRIIQFPDIIIALSPGDYSGDSEGSVVNHVAFRVDSLARLAAAGVSIEYIPDVSGIATTHTPEGERVELFDDEATNLGFTTDGGEIDAVTNRHNQPAAVPVTSHHLHLFVPEEEVLTARDWYATQFGGVAGQRWHYEAVDLPGINLNFSAAKKPVGPTRGRTMDHVGFEVENLEDFQQQLLANGIAFDTPLTTLPGGIKSVFLTDPWGTSIELTEGLANPR